MTPEEVIDDHAAVLEACEMRVDAQEIIGALDAAGYVIVPKEPTPEDEGRFLEKIADDAPKGCWLWTGYTDRDGYGRFRHEPVLAHRYSYTHFVGPIPPDKCVLHKCDVRNCVNPNHLFLGTAADNTADKMAKGRHTRGEDVNNAKLTEEQVIMIRSSPKRSCDLADELGVDISAIHKVRRRHTWKHV